MGSLHSQIPTYRPIMSLCNEYLTAEQEEQAGRHLEAVSYSGYNPAYPLNTFHKTHLRTSKDMSVLACRELTEL